LIPPVTGYELNIKGVLAGIKNGDRLNKKGNEFHFPF
jgi:hypothetical protein